MSHRKDNPRPTSPGRAPYGCAQRSVPPLHLPPGSVPRPLSEMRGITRIFEGANEAVLDHLDLVVVERGEFLAHWSSGLR